MYRTLVTVVLLLAAQVGVAQSQRKPLNDAALDHVTAAGVSATVTQGVVKFAGQVATPNGLVSSTGTLSTLTAPLSTSTTLGTLTLNGSAQQNLSSLVNINAVNSQISVLLNLNVTIDSTVGSIVQSNLTGKH
jgi:hypothetical protein